jgi:hypothetical protein
MAILAYQAVSVLIALPSPRHAVHYVVSGCAENEMVGIATRSNITGVTHNLTLRYGAVPRKINSNMRGWAKIAAPVA